MPVDEWQREYKALRAALSPVLDYGTELSPDMLPLWQRYYQMDANRPVRLSSGFRDTLLVEHHRLLPSLSRLPRHDLSFVTKITIEEYPGALADYYRRLGHHISPLAGVLGNDIIVTVKALERPRESAIGVKGLDEIVAHEVGHTIYSNLPEELSRIWKDAIHPEGNVIQFAQHAAAIGEYNPTSYAAENPAEDFAESYRLYRIGGIDTELVKPANGNVPGEPARLGAKRIEFMDTVSAWLDGACVPDERLVLMHAS